MTTTTGEKAITTINDFFNHKEGKEAINNIVWLLDDFLENESQYDNERKALMFYSLGNTIKLLYDLEIIYKNQNVKKQ